MKLISILLFSFFFCFIAQEENTNGKSSNELSEMGPFSVGWMEVQVQKKNRSFKAFVSYPAKATGLKTIIDLQRKPYPAIAFGHGFFQTVSRYSDLLKHLASWGFIVIAPNSETGMSPSHIQLANDLSSSLSWLALQNQAKASFFYQAVDVGNFGVAGHSMGAGCSLLAAQSDPFIVAVSTLAAAETSPSAIKAMSEISVPVQFLAGSKDKITPPQRHQFPIYHNGQMPRQLPLIIGGYHCGFQDTPFPIGCDKGDISLVTQLKITRKWMTAWFLLYLKKESKNAEILWGPEAFSDPSVELTSESGIDIKANEETQEVQVDEEAIFHFTLKNNNFLSTRYEIKANASCPTTISINQTKELNFDEEEHFTLTAKPAKSGQYPITLFARSLFDEGSTAWLQINIIVNEPR